MDLACCGIECGQCPVFLATQADDDAQRTKLSRSWSKLLGAELAPADMNCDGCLAREGRWFRHCRVCGIRACCADKGLANCAPCQDYPCLRLEELFAVVPMARPGLEKARQTLLGG